MRSILQPSHARFPLPQIQPFTRSLGPGDVAGNGALAAPIIVSTDQDAPNDPPENARVSAVNSTALLVEWSAPTQPNGIVTDYRVGYRLADTGDAYVFVQLGVSFSYTITGLKPYRVYQLRVAGAFLVSETSLEWGWSHLRSHSFEWSGS